MDPYYLVHRAEELGYHPQVILAGRAINDSMPALASRMGASVAAIKVKHAARHHPRIHGVSKYGVTRLIGGMFNLITVKFLLSYSTMPPQLFGVPGVAAGMIGVFIEVYLSTMRLVFGERIANRPLLLLAVLLVFMGG